MDINILLAINFLEIQYKEQMKEKMSLGADIDDLELYDRLFPCDWDILSIDIKIHALKEAIDDNILLDDTRAMHKAYSTLHENRVVMSKALRELKEKGL